LDWALNFTNFWRELQQIGANYSGLWGVIQGGGAMSYNAAIRAAQLGIKCAMIEKDYYRYRNNTNRFVTMQSIKNSQLLWKCHAVVRANLL